MIVFNSRAVLIELCDLVGNVASVIDRFAVWIADSDVVIDVFVRYKMCGNSIALSIYNSRIFSPSNLRWDICKTI